MQKNIIISLFTICIFGNICFWLTENNYFQTLSTEEQNRIKIIDKTNTWIVSIIWKQKVLKYEYNYIKLENWLYLKVPKWIAQEWYQIVSKWTWFFITKNWFIITNKHVLEDTNLTYEVITNDWKKYNIENIYSWWNYDLTLIKIKWNDFNALKLISSKDIMIWQTIIAIGNALWEYQNTVTMWIISWINRDLVAMKEDWTQEELTWTIQIDASINLWNSGWPLLDSNWNVIWINTAIDTKWENIWFAIPTDQIFKFLKGLFKK